MERVSSGQSCQASSAHAELAFSGSAQQTLSGLYGLVSFDLVGWGFSAPAEVAPFDFSKGSSSWVAEGCLPGLTWRALYQLSEMAAFCLVEVASWSLAVWFVSGLVEPVKWLLSGLFL